MATRQTLEQFLKTIRPEQLGTDGRFLGPQSGTNYQAEGLRPEDYFANRINDQRDTGRFQGYGDNMAPVMEDIGSVNANWIEGPRNNGMWGSMTDGFNQMINDPKFQAGLAAVVGGGYLAGGGFGGAAGAGAGETAGFSGIGGTGGSAGIGSGTFLGGAGETAALSGSQIAALSPAATGGGFSFATPEIMTAGTGLDLGAIGTTAIPGEAATAGFSGIGGTGGSAGIGSGTTLGGGGASASSGGLSGIWDKATNYISDPSNLLKIGGTVLGAVGGAAAGGDTTTSNSSSRDPWKEAQPYLIDNLKTNAAMQEHYRQNPFSDLQKQQYQGLFNNLANAQANVPGLLANANAFGQSKRGVMPPMTGLLSGTQAAPIDWTQYQNIGRK